MSLNRLRIVELGASVREASEEFKDAAILHAEAIDEILPDHLLASGNRGQDEFS